MRLVPLFLFFAVVPAQAADYLPPQLVNYPLPTQQVAAAPRQYDCSSGQCRPVNSSVIPNSSPIAANAPYLPPCPCQAQAGGCPCAAQVQIQRGQVQTYRPEVQTYRGSCGSSFGAGGCGLFGGQRSFRPVRGLLGLLFGGCGG